jgi:hypothetical protein
MKNLKVISHIAQAIIYGIVIVLLTTIATHLGEDIPVWFLFPVGIILTLFWVFKE